MQNLSTSFRPNRFSSVVRAEPAKYAFSLFMLTVLVLFWFLRGSVTSAYTDEHEQVTLNLSGIDLTSEKTEVGPSPYLFETAPDTANEPISLAFADNPSADPAEVKMLGGESTIAGTVSDGRIVVPGAVVRLERHTDRGSAFRDLPVSDSGSWSISGVLGGRYRVRAWVPGSHTMDQSTVVFVDEGSQQAVDLTVQEVVSQVTLTAFDSVSIFDGSSGTATLRLKETSVDSEGYLTVRPVSGSVVDVSVLSPGRLLSDSPMLSNGRGDVNFVMSCQREGTVRARVKFGDVSRTVQIARCLPVPEPSEPEPNDSAADETLDDETTTRKPTSTSASTSTSTSASTTRAEREGE